MIAAHRAIAFIAVLMALGGSLLGAQNWLRRHAVSARLLWLTTIMSAVVGVQALLGILLAVTGNRPADGVTHFVVGPLTLFVLPVARRVVGERRDASAAATLTIAWLVLLGLTLRAVGSGGLN